MFAAAWWFACVVLMLRPMCLASQTSSYSSVTDLIVAAKCEALGLSPSDRKEKTQWLSHDTSGGMLWNDCIRSASRDISIVSWNGESPIAEPELICRDVTSFTVGWNLEDDYHDEPVLYAIEFHETGSDVWKPLTTTKDRIITISHLTPGVTYNVRVTAVMAEGQLGRPVTSPDLCTLSGEKIRPVEYADVVKQSMNENGLSVVIKWLPSPDKPCYYEVVKWVPDSQESSIVEVKDVRLNIGTSIYMTLIDLTFDTNYSIAITAEDVNCSKESDKFWLSFCTPTCLQANNWSLTICAPQKPEGLSAVATTSEEGDYLCDVEVSWERPQAEPDHYILSIVHYTAAHWIAQKSHWLNTYQVNATINGSLISAVFRDLEALPRMMITLIAVSEGGRSKEAKIYRNSCILTIQPIPQNYSTDTSRDQPGVLLWSITAFCFVIALSTAVVFVFICRYQSRRKQKEKRAQYFKNLEKDESGFGEYTSHKDIDADDEFEIARDRILISHVLGTGAFGVVHKGLLTNGAGPPTEIAVKTLRDHPSSEEMRQLTKEITILKSVGRHRNIASMLGCCTRCGSRPLLIIEFCALGDLQNFLRQAYKIVSTVNLAKTDGELSESDRVTYADLMRSSSCESQNDETNGKYETLVGLPVVMNKTYDMDNSKLWHAAASLSELDLLSFTRQIAIGMEYLANNKVVHRDLAARNVLVCSDLTMKIADFGLSRDIYEQNFYSKKGSERLPVKWMAIESFLHQIYTTQSDVYNIMLACWTTKPKERPTFSQLVQKLDELLEQVSPQQYLNLNTDLTAMDHTDSFHD